MRSEERARERVAVIRARCDGGGAMIRFDSIHWLVLVGSLRGSFLAVNGWTKRRGGDVKRMPREIRVESIEDDVETSTVWGESDLRSLEGFGRSRRQPARRRATGRGGEGR